MGFFRKITKQAYVLFISEVLFVGILSFGFNKYVFKFMEDWKWWQYCLLLAGVAILAFVSSVIIDLRIKMKRERDEKEMERGVADLQLTVMQEFLKIRMGQAFGDSWVSHVKNVVLSKFDNNDPYKQNYQGIYNVLQTEGVENLNEKSMDITNITALMLHDFYDQCRVGTNFRQQIRNIQTDKNKLVSHISDSSDDLNVKILELTAIKDVRAFLRYLANSEWNYQEKRDFTDKHLARIEQITQDIFKDMKGEDQQKIEFESNRRNYLEKLVAERAENALEYIPLSYKVDDNTSQRYALEELYDLSSNRRGFVIFSVEAGYGKTWSVQELAGACAEKALNSKDDEKITPILIRMGELAEHEEPIMKAVQETLYLGEHDVENAREFVHKESVVLFIDGMDEANKKTKEAAARELKKLMSAENNLRIIGGTRASDMECYPAELPRYAICDLSDMQVEAFIDKLITEPSQNVSAKYDYFENPKTGFLRNLRSPFYLKCFVDFVREGGTSPDSDTDMMNRCINKMIEREISLKGFRVTVQIVNDLLAKLSGLIGDERRYVPKNEAVKKIKDELIYDEEYESVVRIIDTLVELQILKEVFLERERIVLLGFWHENYKSLFSPVALDMSIWDY